MAYIDSNDELQHVRIPPKYSYKKLTRIAYIENTNTFLRKKVVDKHLINQDYHYVIDHEYMLRVTKEFKASRTKRMLACFLECIQRLKRRLYLQNLKTPKDLVEISSII